jgi:hypothetical protein
MSMLTIVCSINLLKGVIRRVTTGVHGGAVAPPVKIIAPPFFLSQTKKLCFTGLRDFSMYMDVKHISMVTIFTPKTAVYVGRLFDIFLLLLHQNS